MMLFWLLFALMTGAAVFAVLWPLAFARARTSSGAEADIAVYRDQLAEIERDRARNLIGGSESEAARVEVARRILAVQSAQEKSARQDSLLRRRAIAVIALAIVPLSALAVYAKLGSPGLPDAPLAERTSKPSAQADVMVLIRRVEEHLRKNPEDGRGWELLGPIYMVMGRSDEALRAFRNARQLLGSTPERDVGVGEALVAQAGGAVTPEAKAAFESAVERDPKNSKARFYLGFAAEKDGDKDSALKHWGIIADDGAPNDPWRNEAIRRMQQMESKP